MPLALEVSAQPYCVSHLIKARTLINKETSASSSYYFPFNYYSPKYQDRIAPLSNYSAKSISLKEQKSFQSFSVKQNTSPYKLSWIETVDFTTLVVAPEEARSFHLSPE